VHTHCVTKISLEKQKSKQNSSIPIKGINQYLFWCWFLLQCWTQTLDLHQWKPPYCPFHFLPYSRCHASLWCPRSKKGKRLGNFKSETTEVIVHEVNYLSLSESVLVIKDINTLIHSDQPNFSPWVSGYYQAELISWAKLRVVLYLNFELGLKTVKRCLEILMEMG